MQMKSFCTGNYAKSTAGDNGIEGSTAPARPIYQRVPGTLLGLNARTIARNEYWNWMRKKAHPDHRMRLRVADRHWGRSKVG